MIIIISVSSFYCYQLFKDENKQIEQEKKHINLKLKPLSVEDIAAGESTRHVKGGRGGYYKVPETTIQIVYSKNGKDKLMNIRSNNVKEKFDDNLKTAYAYINIKDNFGLRDLRTREVIDDYYNNYDVTIIYPNHHWKKNHKYKKDYDKLFIVNKPKKSKFNDE